MKRFNLLPYDLALLGLALIITITGIATIYTITFSTGWGLAVNQIQAGVIGLGLLITFALINYRHLDSYRWIIYVGSIIILIPLMPAIASKIPFIHKTFGAYRWYDLGFFQLQPSELIKVALGIVAAGFLSRIDGRLKLFSALLYMLLCIVPIGLVIVQPDLGTGIILTAIVASLFVAARPTRAVIITVIVMIGISAPIVWKVMPDYQKHRIETFLNPAADPLKKGYNVKQALIAIGSGRVTGRGFGEGSQTTLRFLPVAHADFIFAGYAEATGFVGCSVLLLLYTLLLWRTSDIAMHTQDKFAMYFALAISVKLFAQIVINVGMNIGLLPVTGVPLPMMSHGGTSLIVDFIGIGVLQSIYSRSNRKIFS